MPSPPSAPDGASPAANSRKKIRIACTFCRKRKRRCDGRKPVCTLCQNANNNSCVYPVTRTSAISVRLPTSPRTSLPSRDGIQTRDSQCSQAALQHTEAARTDSDAHHLPSSAVDSSFLSPNHSETIDVANNAPPFIPDADSTNLQFRSHGISSDAMTIPVSHCTTSASLLQSPPVKSLVGDYPPDLFSRIESRRSLPEQLSLQPGSSTQASLPQSSFETAEALFDTYFHVVHPSYPILDYQGALQSLESVLHYGINRDAESACILALLSSGAIATQQPSESGLFNDSGYHYANHAISILLQEWPALFRPTISHSRGFYLVALFFSYLSMPLLAWRFVHMASTCAQQLLIQNQSALKRSSDSSTYQPLIRVCWAIHILECDIIAEYHLPRSGIEQLVDKIALPMHDDPGEVVILNWLANISSRQLLNRVHCAMYDADVISSGINAVSQSTGTGSNTSLVPLLKVADELSYQLSTWYNTLPDLIKPNMECATPSNEDVFVILRYHAAGDIIHRPFLLYICSLQLGSSASPEVFEKALTGLHHCHQYLKFVGRRVESPSAAIEAVLHSTLSCILLITAASLSPLLSFHATNVNELQDQAIDSLKKWAVQGSSIEAMHRIAIAVRDKSRLLR